MNIAPKGKMYAVRTKSISGRVKDVLCFVQEEFCDSLQTAKSRIKTGGLLVVVFSKEDAQSHIDYYAQHGLNAEYKLEDDIW